MEPSSTRSRRPLVYAGLLVAFGGYMEFRGYQHAEDKFTVAAEAARIKADAATAKVQVALDAAHNTQELLDENHRTTVAILATQLRLRAGPANRLRDPHATDCAAPTPAATASAGADDGAPTGGLLSAELTEFLLTQAGAADTINTAYASCRADAIAMRVLQPH